MQRAAWRRGPGFPRGCRVNPLTIGCATEVYVDASRCEIIRHSIDNSILGGCSRLIRGLLQSLADEAIEEFWRQTIGPLRRLAFTFCSTPLPFFRASASIGMDWGKVHRQ